MNKRIAKKKDFRCFVAYMNNINIDEDYKAEAEAIAIDIWCKNHPENPDLTDDDHSFINMTAWQEYKRLINTWNENIRFINLGRRKIHIVLHTDGSGRSDWSFGCFSVCGKEAVFNALTEEEKTIVIMHPHFHKY